MNLQNILVIILWVGKCESMRQARQIHASELTNNTHVGSLNASVHAHVHCRLIRMYELSLCLEV